MPGPSGVFLVTLLLALFLAVSAQSAIRSMSAAEFHEIIKTERRAEYQIVDVREKSELVIAQVPAKSVINLPMSLQRHWQKDVLDKRLLQTDKPTIIICKDGGQSYGAASFFGTAQSLRSLSSAAVYHCDP